MRRARIKLFVKEIPENPILTTFIIFVIVSIIIFTSSYFYFKDDLDQYIRSVLSEAHGMLFDLFVIGILLLWLNRAGEKQTTIKRSHDDIDDIRFWKSEEASFKIQGNIKRLLRNGVNKIELHSCFLKNIKLNYCNLSYSNFNYADLSFSNLVETNFFHAQMNQTKLENSNINKSNFDHALLNGASFLKSKGVKTNFVNAKLIRADFKDAFLIDTNFASAELAGANFENASLYMPDFRSAKGLTYEQFSNVKILVKPKFDEVLEAQIRENFPHLFQANSFAESPGEN